MALSDKNAKKTIVDLSHPWQFFQKTYDLDYSSISLL